MAELTTNESTIEGTDPDIPIYFSYDFVPEKLKNHRVTFEDPHLFVCFHQSNHQWNSLPYAPWGSFYCREKLTKAKFDRSIEAMAKLAQSSNVKSIILKHPPSIYQQSVPEDWLYECGFEEVNREINQHLMLNRNLDLHQMEIRKLEKGMGKMEVALINNWSYAYDLIQQWRLIANIPLNIQKEHLIDLVTSFADKYDCWQVSNESGKILSICISIKVTSKHVYYFLPATNPAFRSGSPMVSMLVSMSRHYQKLGFEYFDLGQSSINGVLQTGLFNFKKRMGALQSHKSTYRLEIATL